MGAAERAKLYLLRKKSRAVILLAILTVIAALVLIGISIGNAANQAIGTLRETMGGYFKIETNRDKGYYDPVSDALVQKILNNGVIKAYNGMDLTYMLADELELEPGRFSAEGNEKARLARVLGNTDTSLNEYFRLRSFSLKEGRHICEQDSGKALISESLAQKNHLSVGDSFTVSFDTEDKTEEQKKQLTSYPLEIAGIFQIDVSQNSGSANAAECDMAENFIFTDTDFIRGVMGEALGRDLDTYSNGASFFVDNPKKMSTILKQITEIPDYDWNGYTVTQNNRAYEESAAPLEHLGGLITIMVLIITVIGSVLLSLVLFLWMRDRIHEIGIYISIGIRKRKIIGQHILENLSIALLAFCLAGIIAGAAIHTVENVVQDSLETESYETQAKPYSVNDEPVAGQDGLAKIEIRIGILEMAEIFGAGILIVVISTAISSGVVLRMRPREILSTMS